MPRGKNQGVHHMSLRLLEERMDALEEALADRLSLEDLALITHTLLPELYRGRERRRDEPAPTRAFPGSAGKLEALADRAARGKALHSGRDEDGVRNDDEGLRVTRSGNGVVEASEQHAYARLRGGRAKRRYVRRGLPAGNSNSLGGRLARLREGLGWSRKRLARRAGVTANALWRIELGLRTPTLGVAVALANALGLPTLDELVGRRPAS